MKEQVPYNIAALLSTWRQGTSSIIIQLADTTLILGNKTQTAAINTLRHAVPIMTMSDNVYCVR